METKPPSIEARQSKQQEELLDELRRSGVISMACKKSGIARATYYRWRKDDFLFAQSADKAKRDGERAINDLARTVVMKHIQEGNLRAATYWLNHRDEAFNLKLPRTEDAFHESLEEMTQDFSGLDFEE